MLILSPNISLTKKILEWLEIFSVKLEISYFESWQVATVAPAGNKGQVIAKIVSFQIIIQHTSVSYMDCLQNITPLLRFTLVNWSYFKWSLAPQAYHFNSMWVSVKTFSSKNKNSKMIPRLRASLHASAVCFHFLWPCFRELCFVLRLLIS